MFFVVKCLNSELHVIVNFLHMRSVQHSGSWMICYLFVRLV